MESFLNHLLRSVAGMLNMHNLHINFYHIHRNAVFLCIIFMHTVMQAVFCRKTANFCRVFEDAVPKPMMCVLFKTTCLSVFEIFALEFLGWRENRPTKRIANFKLTIFHLFF